MVREDTGALSVGPGGALGGNRRGTGAVVDLAAYENDVLNALTRTGGFPGLDAMNTVVIQRGTPPADLPEGTTVATIPGTQQVRIPLRMRPNEPLPFEPKDVILQNGDIIFIESRETEVYYTGGLMLMEFAGDEVHVTGHGPAGLVTHDLAAIKEHGRYPFLRDMPPAPPPIAWPSAS